MKLLIPSVIGAVFFLLMCLGCKTKEVSSPSNSAPFTSAEKSKFVSTRIEDLEQIISQPNQLLISESAPQEPRSDLQAEFKKICESNSGLCGRTVTTPESTKLKFKRHEIIKAFKDQNWSRVSEFTTNHVIQGLKGENQKAISTYSQAIPRQQCELSSARFALGLLLEKWLPEEQVYDLVTNLYSNNLICPESNEVLRSNLRAALLGISKGKCSEIEGQLRALEKTTDSSFKSRGIYWLKECGLRETISENDFPFLSFHGLKAKEHFQLAETPLALNPSTPVSRRLQNHDDLNQMIEFIEIAISQNNIDLSRWMSERLNLDLIKSLPPENQVYFAYLAFLSGAHLRKMQILNPLVLTNSRFQTKTLRDLLYPWVYYEEILAQKSNVQAELIMALIRQESAFDLRARSPVGATGLMQLMYSTARILDRSMSRRDLLDPEKNIRVGTKYFEKLMKNFNGNAIKALAGYNAGPLKVVEWQKRYPTDNELLFAELIPYMETRDYVALVLRNYYIYQQIKMEKEKIQVGESVSPVIQNY